MIRRVLFGLLTITLVGAAVASTNARVWTDRTGRQLDAEYIGFSDGKVEIKRRSDGRTFRVPLERFSDSDQDFVRSQNKAKPVATTAQEAGQSSIAKAHEVIRNYTAIPRHYDSELKKGTVFFDTELGRRASPPLKLSRERKYALTLVPTDHLVKFFLDYAKMTGERLDFLTSLHLSSQVSKALKEHELKPAELTFIGSEGITGSISTEATKPTFASQFLLEIVVSANCKLGVQDLAVLVPTKGKLLAGEGVDTVMVVIPVEVH